MVIQDNRQTIRTHRILVSPNRQTFELDVKTRP